MYVSDKAKPQILARASLLLPNKRQVDSHKGTYGSVGVVGGASGMIGAPLLTARAALYCGAGRVYVGTIVGDLIVDIQHPELMFRPLDTLLKETPLSVLVAGMGMGQSPLASDFLQTMIALNVPLVLDADALNLMAINAHLKQAVVTRNAPTILTPHPLEAARLLNIHVEDVQANRVAATLTLAHQYQSVVILKGHQTMIAERENLWMNENGNPGMAVAGMGDTLAGILGACIAQSLSAIDASKLAVHLHGAAGDALLADGVGPVGMTPSELVMQARKLLNRWIYNSDMDK